MGQIVGVFATSHSPGITGFPERAADSQRRQIEEAFTDVARRMAELRPDAIVAVSVEHFTNFFLNNLPAFAIATAESYEGPATAEMSDFLRIRQHDYLGHAALSDHLYRFALADHFDPALVAGGFTFDENFCVPLHLLEPDSRVPLVPIIVNGVNPPFPTVSRCYRFGQMLRAGIEAQSHAERVVVLGTGGLSHWVGTPESGTINEDFDRDFLRRLASGDPDLLTALPDSEIDLAGNGAHEIRTWLVAAGAAGVGFDTLAYSAVSPWLTGTAVAAARL